MRIRILWVIVLLALALLLPGGGKAVQADSGYLLTAWTSAGGGGSFNINGYSLSGTTGQAEAGHDFRNGVYAFHGGFWHPAGAQQVFMPLVIK
jgi:hypothetical protein